jgi:hypothetical protein
MGSIRDLNPVLICPGLVRGRARPLLFNYRAEERIDGHGRKVAHLIGSKGIRAKARRSELQID